MLPLLLELCFEKFNPKILLALRQTEKMTHRLATQALFHQRNELAVTYQKNFLSEAINSNDIEIDTNHILTCIKNPNFSMDDRWKGLFVIAAKNKLVLSSNIKAIEMRIKDEVINEAIKERSKKLLNTLINTKWLKYFKKPFFRLTDEEQINYIFEEVLNKLNDDSVSVLPVLTAIAPRLTKEQIGIVYDKELDKVNGDSGNLHTESFRILIEVIGSRLTKEQIATVYDKALKKLNGGSMPVHDELLAILTAMAPRLSEGQIDIVYNKELTKLNGNSYKAYNELFAILTVIVFRLTKKQINTIYDKALKKLNGAVERVHQASFQILTVIASQLTQEQIDTVCDRAISKFYDKNPSLLRDIVRKIVFQLSQEQVGTLYNKALKKLINDSGDVNRDLFYSLEMLKEIAPRLTKGQIDTLYNEAMNKLEPWRLRRIVGAIISPLTKDQVGTLYNKALNNLINDSEDVNCDSFEMLIVIASRLTQKQIDTVFNEAMSKLYNNKYWFLLLVVKDIGPYLTQEQITIVFDKALNKLNADLRDDRCISLKMLTEIAPRLTEKQIIELALIKLDDWDSGIVRKVEDLLSYIIVLGKWNCSELNKINVQNSPHRISIQHFAELFHQITSPNANKRKECSPKLDIGFFSSQPPQKKIKLENNALETPTLS